MAARGAISNNFGFRLLIWPRNAQIPQGRRSAKLTSVRLCMKSPFVRNLCSLDATSKIETSQSVLTANLKATSYRIRKLCEDQKLNEASDLLDRLLVNYGSTNTNLARVFNCILHHGVRNRDSKLVEYLLHNMTKYNIQRDKATFYIQALYYSEHGMLDKGIKALREMQTEGLKTSPRNYQPLIDLAARMGNMETMFSLYDEMKAKHKDCYHCDAVVIQEVVDSTEGARWRNKVLGILHNLKADRMKLNQETSVAVSHWFESQLEDKWQINWATVNSSGVCQSCGHTLQSGALSSLEYAVLEEHIIDYLWTSTRGRKMTSYTTIGSFADKHYPEDGHHLPYSLEKYIKETGPYDVVLDALNVGYYGNRGEFHPQQVEQTVQHFLNDDKKVLVVGAPPMLTRKLRNASQQDFSSLIDITSKHCGLFLIGVRSSKNAHKLCIPDDIFILLAAVHCGLNTLLVSNDLFQDHMHKLPVNGQTLLRRWLRSNQVLLTRLPNDNKISYKRHPSYDPVVQTTGHTWHLPSEDNLKWLCINKQH